MTRQQLMMIKVLNTLIYINRHFGSFDREKPLISYKYQINISFLGKLDTRLYLIGQAHISSSIGLSLNENYWHHRTRQSQLDPLVFHFV
jgi:hypothetical protein